MSALIGLLALAALTGAAMRVARKTAAANRRINADVAFLRSMPGGVEQ